MACIGFGKVIEKFVACTRPQTSKEEAVLVGSQEERDSRLTRRSLWKSST